MERLRDDARHTRHVRKVTGDEQSAAYLDGVVSSATDRARERLLSQIERVMQINELRYVTKEVVESARELLVIGPS